MAGEAATAFGRHAKKLQEEEEKLQRVQMVIPANFVFQAQTKPQRHQCNCVMATDQIIHLSTRCTPVDIRCRENVTLLGYH